MTAKLKSRTYFWYDTVYPKNHRKAKTAGRRRIGALAITEDNSIVIATAVCSEKDQFVRKTGRNKAQGRMLSAANGNRMAGGKFANISEILETPEKEQVLLFGGSLPLGGERPLIQHLVKLAVDHPLPG